MTKTTIPAQQAATNSEQEASNARHANSPLQRQIDASPRQLAQRKQLTQLREDASLESKPAGLPLPLRAGIEALSGVDMSDVVVHRNSDKPKQMNALAYAQGKNIHLGSGQERHLPHEAWHVVQQRKGRVKPTASVDGVAINDDSGLEREADAMGARALQMKALPGEVTKIQSSDYPVQMALPHNGFADTKGYYNSQGKAKNQIYKGGRPADFSTKFKMNMVKNQWSGAYNQDTDLWHVVTSGHSEVVLPTNAIQIDHKVPWNTIESTLLEDPSDVLDTKKLNALESGGYINEDHDSYTVYAARMYYHDVANLQPMAGSENASKGAGGGNVTVSLETKWKSRVARSAGLHHKTVQSAFGALRDWSSDGLAVTELLGEFDKVDSALLNAEDYFVSY